MLSYILNQSSSRPFAPPETGKKLALHRHKRKVRDGEKAEGAKCECAPIKRISFCIDTRKYFQRSSAMPPSAKKQRTEPGSAGSSSNDMEPPEETVSVRRMRLPLARCKC